MDQFTYTYKIYFGNLIQYIALTLDNKAAKCTTYRISIRGIANIEQFMITKHTEHITS